jgi:choice-of-anchor B domain-containing protein
MNVKSRLPGTLTLLALLGACSGPLSEPIYDQACTGGYAGPFPCSQVDLAAFLPLEMLNAGSLNDVWGWVDSDSDREFVLVGTDEGTTFVEITTPTSPVVVGALRTEGFWVFGQSQWRDIKVIGDHMVVVSEARGHGMQIFDLKALLAPENIPAFFEPTLVYKGGPADPLAVSGLLSALHPEADTGHEDDTLSHSHNVATNETSQRAFLLGTNTCGGGIHMVDLSNPDAPAFDGCVEDAGYVHDAQCVTYVGPDSGFVGQEICFAFAARVADEEGAHFDKESRLVVVDVTTGNAPVVISDTPYTGGGYAHQGWLTEDHANLLANDELDELRNGHFTRTLVWDLSSLSAPDFLGHHTHEIPAIDHNLFIRGNKVFEANYTAGLRILEYGNLDNLVLDERAYFDTYPSHNKPEFFGAWGVFPFFPSSTLAVSSMDEGLFILRSNLP